MPGRIRPGASATDGLSRSDRFEHCADRLRGAAEQLIERRVGGRELASAGGEKHAEQHLRLYFGNAGFGLANPALFALLSDPERGNRLAASAAGVDVLRECAHRVAAAGRLTVTEERAIGMIHAAGTSVVLALLTVPAQQRDPGLADSMYAAVKQAILIDTDIPPRGGAIAAAVALRAGLSDAPVLSNAESALMTEWLDRVADH